MARQRTRLVVPLPRIHRHRMWLQVQGHIGRSDSEATQRASRENSLPVWCSHLSHLERPKRKKYLYASTQVEQNPVLWLVTRAGNMELSCPLMITRCAPQEKFPPEPYKKILYWPSFVGFFFLRELMDPVEKQPKKGLAVYFVSSYTFFCISKYIPIKQTIATYR